MASMNLRIIGAVAARAGSLAGQKTSSGSGPDSSPSFQDMLDGARTPKTPKTPRTPRTPKTPLAPAGFPSTSAQTPASRTPVGSPMALTPKVALGAFGERVAAVEQLPRLLGRRSLAPAPPMPAARAGALGAKAHKVKFEEDPFMLAAQAKEALVAHRQRLAERRAFMQGGVAFRP